MDTEKILTWAIQILVLAVTVTIAYQKAIGRTETLERQREEDRLRMTQIENDHKNTAGLINTLEKVVIKLDLVVGLIESKILK